MQFKRGDIVQVEYASPARLSQWMEGWNKVGPGEIGIVKFDNLADTPSALASVHFPLLGTFAMHVVDLKLLGHTDAK